MGGDVGELVFRSMSSGIAPPVKHFGIQPMMLLRETRALHFLSANIPCQGPDNTCFRLYGLRSNVFDSWRSCSYQRATIQANKSRQQAGLSGWM